MFSASSVHSAMVADIQKALRQESETDSIRLRLEQYPLLLDKKELLTSKMALDLAKITNLEEYKSFREYLLGTTITIYDRASLEGQTDANMLCQFARYVKSLVAELDRMKTVKKEEIIPEPEFGDQ